MRRRSIYLYHGNGDYRRAMFGVGPTEGPDRKLRAYSPTRASDQRLREAMEHILDSKQFWLTIVGGNSLTIIFETEKRQTP